MFVRSIKCDERRNLLTPSRPHAQVKISSHLTRHFTLEESSTGKWSWIKCESLNEKSRIVAAGEACKAMILICPTPGFYRDIFVDLGSAEGGGGGWEGILISASAVRRRGGRKRECPWLPHGGLDLYFKSHGEEGGFRPNDSGVREPRITPAFWAAIYNDTRNTTR